MVEITVFGNPLHLVGTPPEVGDPARDFTAIRFSPEEGMVEVTLADLPAIPRLLSVVPSLDTPTCSAQTRAFNERLHEYGDRVAAYAISLDLPFAQRRFCGDEDIDAMTTLSDYRDRSFGYSWGLLIEETKLLARSVYVLDSAGRIAYAQLVSEGTNEPDYEPALWALDALLDAS